MPPPRHPPPAATWLLLVCVFVAVLVSPVQACLSYDVWHGMLEDCRVRAIDSGMTRAEVDCIYTAGGQFAPQVLVIDGAHKQCYDHNEFGVYMARSLARCVDGGSSSSDIRRRRRRRQQQYQQYQQYQQQQQQQQAAGGRGAGGGAIDTAADGGQLGGGARGAPTQPQDLEAAEVSLQHGLPLLLCADGHRRRGRVLQPGVPAGNRLLRVEPTV
ncbi:epsilon-adaptin [Gracilaria domingensis]|nr:epsilon-adaptin [Gracilaria domingensis]